MKRVFIDGAEGGTVLQVLYSGTAQQKAKIVSQS